MGAEGREGLGAEDVTGTQRMTPPNLTHPVTSPLSETDARTSPTSIRHWNMVASTSTRPLMSCPFVLTLSETMPRNEPMGGTVEERTVVREENVGFWPFQNPNKGSCQSPLEQQKERPDRRALERWDSVRHV